MEEKQKLQEDLQAALDKAAAPSEADAEAKSELKKLRQELDVISQREKRLKDRVAASESALQQKTYDLERLEKNTKPLWDKANTADAFKKEVAELKRKLKTAKDEAEKKEQVYRASKQMSREDTIEEEKRKAEEEARAAELAAELAARKDPAEEAMEVFMAEVEQHVVALEAAVSTRPPPPPPMPRTQGPVRLRIPSKLRHGSAWCNGSQVAEKLDGMGVRVEAADTQLRFHSEAIQDAYNSKGRLMEQVQVRVPPSEMGA